MRLFASGLGGELALDPLFGFEQSKNVLDRVSLSAHSHVDPVGGRLRWLQISEADAYHLFVRR